MTIQYDHKVVSSFLIWLNYVLLKKGNAFNNLGSYFYPSNPRFNGFTTYSAPYRQLIYDQSITGVNLPTGIYLNSTFIVPGQSGFAGINYEKGEAYFNLPIPSSVRVSGSYSIKDFNIHLTNEPELKILFEKQIAPRVKYSHAVTGLMNDEITYPAIFVKVNGRENKPFALGGQETTRYYISTYIFADDKFKLDGCVNILSDTARGHIPLLELHEMPFNSSGLYASGYAQPFNYTGITYTKTPDTFLFIRRAYQGQFNKFSATETVKLNPEVFTDFIDFEIESVRYPRL